MAEESRIELANRLMDIERALHFISADVLGAHGKNYCPFGEVSHADGGWDRAMRIYPTTNSAYCFACSSYFDPVKLVAMKQDLTYQEAASVILDEVGYVPPTALARFNAAASPVTGIETSDMAEALKVFLRRRFPNWETRQFEDAVGTKFNLLLSLLPKVHTSEEASTWMSAAKRVMEKELSVDARTE